MSTVAAPASAREALDMVRAALGFLAAFDATALDTETQALVLRELERDEAVLTAARASSLAAFTSGQGYCADADYSPRAWLMHQTGITPGRGRRAYRLGPADRYPPAGPGGAGRAADLRVLRADHLPVDGQAPAGVPGDGGRDPAGGGGRRDGVAGPGRAGRRDVRAVPRRPARRGSSPGL
jgi:hypothetical protein